MEKERRVRRDDAPATTGLGNDGQSSGYVLEVVWDDELNVEDDEEAGCGRRWSSGDVRSSGYVMKEVGRPRV